MTTSSEPLTITEVVWFTLIISIPILIYIYGLYRDLRNRPLSKISSLSIGRVEISGIAKCSSKGCLFSPYSKTECCFYYAITRTGTTKNDYISDKQISYEPFILSHDGSECLVYPANALLKGKNFKVQQFKKGRKIYTETLILQDMPLFIDGICAFDDSININEKFEKLFTDSMGPANVLPRKKDKKLIIRAPDKKKDSVNFEFIISTSLRENLIKSLLGYSALMLIVIFGSATFLLAHYLT